MRFHYLTDSGIREIVPYSAPMFTPFAAYQDVATLARLSACWRERTAAFPINPKLPRLPEMPKTTQKCATFLLTSGSSGPPKIACHSLVNYTCSALGSLQALKLSSSDRWQLTLPLFHVGGIAILFRCALAGATVVLSDLPLLDALLQHRVTHLSLVPTQLYRLLQEDPRKLERAAKQLKVVLVGGAPLSATLLAKAHSFGLPIHPTYGLTEMSSQVTMDPYPGALPYREIRVAKDGEIFVKGRTLFQGYYDEQRGETVLDLDDQEWFGTKDLGKWKEEGTLELMGRKDNLFISGGENIQPEEIEAVLLSQPRIIEAMVVPQSDPEFGMRPVAYLRQEGELYTIEELRERLKPLLPSYKIPVNILPLQEDPLRFKRNRKDTPKELLEAQQK